MDTKISVVIPAYQNIEELNKCLNSVLSCDVSTDDYEIMVVDDGSKPPLREKLISDERIRYIYQARNEGASAARNNGVNASKHDIIYFIDSDVEIFKPNLQRISNHFEDESVKAVVGISHYLPLNSTYMAAYQGYFEYFLHYNPEVEFVDCFNPRNAAIRREVFLGLGGFDKSFGTTLEEAEFTQRLLCGGIRIKNDTELIVRHKHSSSLRKAMVKHFSRGYTWFRIYLKRVSKVTVGEGFPSRVIKGIFLHFLFFAALPMSFFSLRFIWLALIFYVLHLWYFAPFYKLCFTEEGLIFAIKAVLTKSLMSFTLGASLIFSLFSLPFYRKDVL